MDALSDEELYRLGKRIIRTANSFLVELADEGLTTEMIGSITMLVAAFDNSIDAKSEAANARELKTQERIEAGNSLYKETVRICNIGKDLFATNDPVRYNDYVIYDSPVTPATKPENGTSDPVA